MSKYTRHEYRKNMKYRYLRANSRSCENRLLTAVAETLIVGRKYLIRCFGALAIVAHPNLSVVVEVQYDWEQSGTGLSSAIQGQAWICP
jgi:hypothetical protein